MNRIPVRARRVRSLRSALPALVVGTLLATGCAEPETRTLVVVGTTDVHGNLLPYDYATGGPGDGSLAQVATVVDSIRREEEAVLLVDSGDLLQGTALNEHQARAGMDSVHPVIAAMNAAGYDAAAVGNHEFNYGIPFLRRALEGADFPFLSANVRALDDARLPWLPHVVVPVDGLRVGIVGLTTPGVAIWDRGHVEGRLTFEDMVEAGRRAVAEARRAGADVVIVVAHAGPGPGSSYAASTGVPEENAVHRLVDEVAGIDVVFMGHTHEEVSGRHREGVLLLQARRFATSVAVARLTVRREDGDARVVSSDGRVIPTGAAAPSPRVEAVVQEAHRATLRWLDEPIGHTAERWSAAEGRLRDTPIADLIARVEREASGAELASTAVFDPAAGFGPGPITRRDVLSLYIYPNTLKAVRISGADLRAYLERSARYFHTWPADPLVNDSVPGYNYDVVSGVDYVIDLRRSPGERITDLRRDGLPVMPTDSFTLALNNYRQAGGGGFEMVARAPVVFSTEREVAGLIADFVAARDTLRTAEVFRENWRIVPPEAVEALRREAASRARH